MAAASLPLYAMIRKAVSLKDWNTFGLDASAAMFYAVQDLDSLRSIWKSTILAQSSPLVLGGGSNILFTRDYPGIILKNELSGRSVVSESGDQVLVKAASGENWHSFVLWCIENGWGGIENLSLIPGTVGAAPIQNIGAYGVEIKDVFHELEAFHIPDGKMIRLDAQDCGFGYRDSIFKRELKGKCLITSVTFRLTKKPQLHTDYGDIRDTLQAMNITQPGIRDVSNAVIAIRSSKLPDPSKPGNCGSFFKNPVISAELFADIKSKYPEIRSFPAAEGTVKVPAAWLIEQCGWKGKRVGNTGVHDKQALVLINHGHALGNEVVKLAFDIIDSVKQKFGIQLEPEVNII